MGNKEYAREWLSLSKKNLDTAQVLFDLNHYEDIIGVELQQCLEKALKSICAYQNIKIPREHDLVKIYFIVEPYIHLENENIVLLRIATDYYKDDRYPNPNYFLPSRNEIKEVLEFARNIFNQVCALVGIEQEDLL